MGKCVRATVVFIACWLPSLGCASQPQSPPGADPYEEDIRAAATRDGKDITIISYLHATVRPLKDVPEIAKRKGAVVQSGDILPPMSPYVGCMGFGAADGQVRRLIVYRRTNSGVGPELIATPGQVPVDVGQVFLHRGNIVVVREDGRQWIYDVDPTRLDAVLWKHVGKADWIEVTTKTGFRCMASPERVVEPSALTAALRELGVDDAALTVLGGE